MVGLSKRKPWYRILYVQVLIGVAAGIAIGHFWPETGVKLKPLAEGFISLIKMLIGPIIFCTVVHGIASLGDLKKLGRIGWKTILYFETVSTFALVIGLVVVNVLKPGEGFVSEKKITEAEREEIAAFEKNAKEHTTEKFFLDIIPKSFFAPLVGGDLLQVLLVSLLTAFGITLIGSRGPPLLKAIDTGALLLFAVLQIIVQLAPLGALGAMAYTVGKFGIGSLTQVGYLMLAFYLTAAVFIFVVLNLIARAAGFSLWKYLRFIKDELILVLGTSSSETALPGMIRKLEQAGCSESTVGLVIPTGYSFNLDGTNIYLSMAAIFLAQVNGISLSLGEQLQLLLIAMLTSKGASGVTGAGFVTLAATLAAVKTVPVESMALLLGVDRFMSECRSLTNLIGNGVATLVISRWEGEITAEALNANLTRLTDDLQPPAQSAEHE